MRLPTFAVGFLLLALAPAASRADTITYSFSHTFTNFSGTSFDSFGVPQFNRALGTLDTITETLSGNIVLTGNGTYYFSTENGITQSSASSGTFFKQIQLADTYVGGYVANPGFPGYRLDFLDYLTTGTATFSSIGPVVNTYTYTYTPAAVTPEPSSLLLLSTGLAGVCAQLRRRTRHC